MQDKIHVNDKWDVTPALRYSHYNSFSGTRQAKRDSFRENRKRWFRQCRLC
ncbi:TonB-dependent receptor [Dialister invisus]|uniref:TonB-dependent receptor n=1 Tax=Dialister invisus TaxID=218538 RepID=UPI0039A2E8CB